MSLDHLDSHEMCDADFGHVLELYDIPDAVYEGELYPTLKHELG